MIRILFYTLLLGMLAAGCSEADHLLYNDSARLQINDTTAMSYTFFYEPETMVQDTVYVEVFTIGDPVNQDRPVTLVQVAGENQAYPAVSGQHFVPLDDPAIKPLMVVKANQVSGLIPVVVKRDAGMKQHSYRLRLQLAANEAFLLGEEGRRVKTVIVSDKLERFYSWRADDGTAPAFYTFGKYSTAKHQFMYDVLQVRVDEEWYKAISDMQAQQHYKNLVKEALNAFNTDPANLASGAAPLRESSDPASSAVTFP
ncbi:MAG: DUF4843 domain-containing protein [Candidatus Pseudobacter hemicellulosilyticus]|uniref:DUF4843 domain-containing protein n=1 Tax=Candidatus Pseudobacter hemicellulosilyticus TaxID=3121375 RepID=A0AAJ6BEH7_9BACT|nr:MAG: DUF4843 domain-containing protein [Pseudobacter sp.]